MRPRGDGEIWRHLGMSWTWCGLVVVWAATTRTGQNPLAWTGTGPRAEGVAALREVFDQLAAEALAAYDRIIGLDLSDVAVDGSQHKAPGGGEGTGPNCTDKRRSGWKWSLATDTHAIPIDYVSAPAKCNDCKLVAATFDDIASRGLLDEIETLHLARGYDFE